jgi:DNA-binding MarR family transcriptional regulator
MATNWLSDTEMTAWRTYIETYSDLIAEIERDLAVHDLTLGDYQVFVYLSEAPERSLRMCDLADVLQLSPSGLTRRLDGLVKAGFVTRQPSTDDRRVMLASLTPEGLATLEAAAPDHVASVRRHVFDHLDSAQIEALASIFQSIKDGLAA